MLFVIANIGVSGSFVFYDSLLPHVARRGETGSRVDAPATRSATWAAGCCSRSTCAWIQKPEWFGLPDAGVATRLSFVSVAVWWWLFSIPLFRRVPEPPSHEALAAAGSVWTAAFGGSAAPCAISPSTSRRS